VTISKLIVAGAVVALLAGAAREASARVLKPGQYSLGGIQEICIVAGGSWYSTTQPGWGGSVGGVTRPSGKIDTFLTGNFSLGWGNDLIVVSTAGAGNMWIRWYDSGLQDPPLLIAITKVKTMCDPPPGPSSAKPKANLLAK
jgi:hypothetical protein